MKGWIGKTYRKAVSALLILALVFTTCATAFAGEIDAGGVYGLSDEVHEGAELLAEGGSGTSGDDGTGAPGEGAAGNPDEDGGAPGAGDKTDGNDADNGEDNTGADDPSANGDGGEGEGDGTADDGISAPEPEQTGALTLPGKRGKLKGMPRGYRLNSRQYEQKVEMSANGDVEAVEEANEGEDYAPDEIVFLADTLEEAKLIAEAYGSELESFSYGVAVATIEENNPASVEDLVKVAADVGNNMPPVAPNAYFHAFGDVEPFALPQENVSAQWHLGEANGINVQRAWEYSTGSGVVVGVLDSGARTTHSGIAPNLISSVDVLSGTLVDSTTDGNGHGTHVAGIIMAAANNGSGAVGVAPDSRLRSYKVLDSGGSGSTATLTRGINKAREDGVHIINMSLGGRLGTTAERTAIWNAMSKGIAVVAAAGNDNSNVKMYPACHYPEIITVAATDQNKRRSSFSNFGPWVDVSAPGSGIISLGTANDNARINMSGTSQATPVVSGVAALILSRYANTAGSGFDLNGDNKRNIDDVRELRKRVRAAVTPTSIPMMGTGVIDANVAVASDTIAPKFIVKVQGAPWTPKTVPAGKRADGSEAYRTEIELFTGAIDAIHYTINGKNPTAASAKYDGTPITFGAPGKYVIRAVSVSPAGKYSKVVSSTYTAQIAVDGVNISHGNLQNLIEKKKKSLQLAASVVPSNATTKKLNWKLTSVPPGAPKNSVKVSATGKLEIAATAIAGDYTVEVSATDAYWGIYKPSAPIRHTFTIHPDAIVAVDINKARIPNYLTAGQSVTLSALHSPSDAKRKAVVWRLLNDEDNEVTSYKNIKITNAGKLTVGKKPMSELPETVTARVRITDSGGVAKEAEAEIRITDNAVTRIALPSKMSMFAPLAGFAPGPLNGFEFGTQGTQTWCNLTEYSFGSAKSAVTYAKPFGEWPDDWELWESVEFVSSNKKVATVDPVTGKVTAVGKGKTTITARATDASKKSAKCVITVTNPVTSLTISPPGAWTATGAEQHLAAGRSMNLKAAVNSNAGNKKLTWRVVPVSEGVGAISGKDFTLSSSGKLTARAGAAEGAVVKVMAVARDATARQSNIIEVTLHTRAVSSVSFPAKTARLLTQPMKSGSRWTVSNELSTQVATVNGASAYNKCFYSSNKPDIAKVDPLSGKITAVRPGKATIKATAMDYSGKSASYTVTVNIPASSLYIASPRVEHSNWGLTVGAGTSITFRPILGAAYGSPTERKAEWKIRPAAGASPAQLDLYNHLVNVKKYISINKSTGKLTASSKIVSDSKWKASSRILNIVEVVATTADGTNIESSAYQMWIMNPTKKVSLFSDYKSKTLKAGYIHYGLGYAGAFYTDAGNYIVDDGMARYGFTYISSKPEVAYVPVNLPSTSDGNLIWRDSSFYNKDIGNVVSFPIVASQKGTTKITITANDGSGRKATFTVVVK